MEKTKASAHTETPHNGAAMRPELKTQHSGLECLSVTGKQAPLSSVPPQPWSQMISQMYTLALKMPLHLTCSDC